MSKCTVCGTDGAYVGFTSIECSNTKCRCYKPKPEEDVLKLEPGWSLVVGNDYSVPYYTNTIGATYEIKDSLVDKPDYYPGKWFINGSNGFIISIDKNVFSMIYTGD